MEYEYELTISFVEASDYEQWMPIWQAYLAFYNSDLPANITQTTWERFLDDDHKLYCIVAKYNHKIVGFATFTYHLSTWSTENYCYLEDLFVVENQRGKHIGKSLIEFIHAEAQKNNSAKVYWHTDLTNKTAQRLYDWIGKNAGAIKYEQRIHYH